MKWLLNVFYMRHKVGSDSVFSISFFLSREPLRLSNYISDISPHTIMKYIRMNAWLVYLGPVLSVYIYLYFKVSQEYLVPWIVIQMSL